MTDEDEGTHVELDAPFGELVDRYRAAKANAKASSDAAADYGKRIMERLRAAADTEPELIVGTIDGRPVARMRVVWTTRLDTDKLRAAAPSVMDEFSVTRPSVRLTIPAGDE
jgi:hypothetical protein